ncbi:MAG: lipocalin family protein [Prevotellaceae bacterium]|nr:lipocalin family protein [Prevotellaceae bacterium]
MKKTLLLAMILPLCAGLCLTSCKKSNEDLLIGTWNVEKMSNVSYENGTKTGEENIPMGEQSLVDYMGGGDIPAQLAALLQSAKVNVKYSLTFEKNGNFATAMSIKFTGLEALIAAFPAAATSFKDQTQSSSGTYTVDGDKLKIAVTNNTLDLEMFEGEITIKSISKKQCVLETVIEDGVKKDVATITLSK